MKVTQGMRTFVNDNSCEGKKYLEEIILLLLTLSMKDKRK